MGKALFSTRRRVSKKFVDLFMFVFLRYYLLIPIENGGKFKIVISHKTYEKLSAKTCALCSFK
jgi:hypothetical protein